MEVVLRLRLMLAVAVAGGGGSGGFGGDDVGFCAEELQLGGC